MRAPLTYTILFFLVVSATMSQGCRKNDNNEPAAPSTLKTISYSGDAMAGYAVSFSSDATNAKKYQWTFGDGGTSAEPKPGHMFADTGTYLVSLMINDDTTLRVTTKLTVFRAPANTRLMEGDHVWRHSWGRSLSGAGDTTVYGPDVTMRISYINPATIAIGQDTLKYVPASPVDENYLRFSSTKRGEEYLLYSTSEITRDLIFRHGVTDSISYSIVNMVSPRGHTFENYYSP